MRQVHVSDIQIQQYLFDIDNCAVEVIEHINNCKQCKNVVSEYQYISQTVKKIPEPALNFDLAASIIEKLPITPQKEKSVLNKNALVLLGFGVLTILLHLAEIDLINWNKIENQSIYFVFVIGLFVGVLWTLDMINTFKKKMTF